MPGDPYSIRVVTFFKAQPGISSCTSMRARGDTGLLSFMYEDEIRQKKIIARQTRRAKICTSVIDNLAAPDSRPGTSREISAALIPTGVCLSWRLSVRAARVHNLIEEFYGARLSAAIKWHVSRASLRFRPKSS